MGWQKERWLQIGRSGLFFAVFLPNIQIFSCEIVKNYFRWGQFSLGRLLPPRLLGAARGLSGQAFAAACDVRLPRETPSLALAIELQITQGIPCLLMTDESRAEVRAAAQANGLQLLIKPVKPQTLLDGLGSLCATPEPL